MDKNGKIKTKRGETESNRLQISHLHMNGGMGDFENLLNIIRS
jgi:hypothetical protein